ncbi:putative phosphatidic acid phosphatase type 2/haloperoxidase [Plasmopara halstedii]
MSCSVAVITDECACPRSFQASSGNRCVEPSLESSTSVACLHSKNDGVKWKRFFHNCRVIEFAITVIMYGFALCFNKIEVAQREIPNIEVPINSTMSVWVRDPTINRRAKVQQVPMFSLVSFGIGAPVITNFLINYVFPKFCHVRIIPHDTRDFLLTLVQSTSMATLLTEFTKNMAGRFRPCFYDICDWNYDEVWDGVTNLCRSASGEKEGRKSFPSGHAHMHSRRCLFLRCKNRSETITRGGLNFLKFFLCFIPTFLAAWVAVTRTIDNWHHYADILAGSIIGAVSTCLSYSYNYASIFHSRHAGVPLHGHYATGCKEHSINRHNTQTSSESFANRVNGNSKSTRVCNDHVVNVTTAQTSTASWHSK